MAPYFCPVFFQSVQHIDPLGGQQSERHLYPAVPVHGPQFEAHGTDNISIPTMDE